MRLQIERYSPTAVPGSRTRLRAPEVGRGRASAIYAARRGGGGWSSPRRKMAMARRHCCGVIEPAAERSRRPMPALRRRAVMPVATCALSGYGSFESKQVSCARRLNAQASRRCPRCRFSAGEPWEYRNRIRPRVMADGDAIRVGYNRRGGDEFLPITECPIDAPRRHGALPRRFLRLSETDAEARRWMRAAAEVEFFCSDDESKLQMTIFTRKPLSTGFAKFCDGLHAVVPELTGAGCIDTREASPCRRSDGQSGRLPERVGGLRPGTITCVLR